MASQLTVWRINSLTGAGITGEVVRVYDPTITTMKASTEGGEQGGGVLAIVDNGNGSYTVAAGLAYQTIAIAFNSTTAAETGYENIQWDGDDVHTHLDNLTKHRLINDSGTTTTVLLSASKIIATYLAKTDIDGTTVGLNGDGELEVKDSGIGNDKLGTAAVETINVKDANITVAKINYDTNDFEADGTSLSIKQNFSSEEILNEGKSLNENLGRLQSRLKELEGSIGGLKRRIIYSDYERATNTINNEASAIREYNSDDDTWKAIVRFPFWKHSGDTTIVLKCEMKTPTGNEVLVKLEGNSSSLDSTSTPAAAYTTEELSANISSYTDDSINDMVVSFKAVTNTGYIKNIIVEVIGSE